MQKRRHPSHEPPIFDLNAFSEKATTTDFYIETLHEHLQAHKFINKPHKHDFYLILYVLNGSGTHTIDFKEYEVQTRSIFLMTPGQVHSWQLHPGTTGFILFFTKAFYQMSLGESKLLEFPFYHSFTATPSIVVGSDVVVDFVFDQMHLEYAKAPILNLRLLRSYLEVLLLKLSTYFPEAGAIKLNSATYKLRKLEQIIESNFQQLRQPKEYAELMSMSTSHLNSICKDNLGKTLTEVIQDRVILEAKRLFAYTDLNVNEIAARLNFADVSYFIRFFKKQVGMTPEKFKGTMG